ncbi:MAG: DnaJ domain-containing protein, partial [Blastocatellia bacterium]|nr:DnaJ domain-containing protein [Blastocatellia bacterium]
GQPVTQSDLYSSGATVVRLLTGIHPTKLTKQRTEKLDWERHVIVSRPFVDLINSLLIRDPLRRLQNTELLLASLRELESSPYLLQQSIISRSQDPPTATAIVHTGQSATGQNYRSAVASIITAIYKTEEICEGSLSLTPLPVLLFRCYQKNLTGAISLKSTDKTKTIYFDQGSIVFATSSQPEDRLGERLFRQGRISLEDFKRATTFVDQTGQRMGIALLQLGIIAIEEFVPIVIDHISSIVYSAFEWVDSQYKFEAITTPDEAIKMPFSTADIIFEGIRRLDNMDLIQQWLGDFDRPLKTTTDPLLLYQAVSLTPHEAFIVSRIDTAMSIEELLSMGGLPEEETLKTVAALLSIRMLEISDDSQIHSKLLGADPVSRILELPNPLPQDFDFSTAAVFCYEVEGKLRSLETADAYQTLEISKNATERDITDAYNQLARKFHPDRNSQLLNYNLTLRSDLEKIFSCLTQAYQSLKENRSKVGQHITATVSNPKVEHRVSSLTYDLFDELVERGKRAYELGRYQEAKENFERAYKQNPSSAEIHFNLARTIAHLPGGFDLAEKQFYKAIELAPENADYYAEFGLFLKKFSLDVLAEAMFRNCLRIAPDHPIAKRSLS